MGSEMCIRDRASTVRELVDRAVTELCPELLVYEGSLETEPKIVADGYEFIRTVEHPRAGTIDQVKRMVDDGEIYISNSRDTSFCQVAFSGEGSRAIFDDLIVDPSRIAEDFFPILPRYRSRRAGRGFIPWRSGRKLSRDNILACNLST